MSAVRQTRFVLALCLPGAAFMIMTCTAAPPRPIVPTAVNCGGHKESTPSKPIVCIDDSGTTLTANPDSVHVFHATRKFFGSPVKIEWFTTSGGGDPQIKFDADNPCVKNIKCEKGHCTAHTTKKYNVKCKYEVSLTGHPTLDPDTDIVKCCSP